MVPVDFGNYEYDPSIDMSGYVPLSKRLKIIDVSDSSVESLLEVEPVKKVSVKAYSRAS